MVERGEQIGGGAIERLGRVVFEFGNGVHEFVFSASRRVHRRRGAGFAFAASAGLRPAVHLPPLKGLGVVYRLPSAEALGYHLPSRCARLVVISSQGVFPASTCIDADPTS